MVNSILPLTMRGVCVRKAGRAILGPIDLDVGPGATTVVIGPNGAGKTTLLRTIHGLERLRAGSLSWAVDTAQALRRQSMVFQKPIALHRPALDNVAYPMRLRGVARRTAKERARAMLARVGLDELASLAARSLSAGEMQKMAMARALITEPELLLLDEPTSNLDGKSTREIEALVGGAKADGVTIVMATHDLGQMRRLAQRVLFVHQGRIHEAGEAAAFIAGPRTDEAKRFMQGEIV